MQNINFLSVTEYKLKHSNCNFIPIKYNVSANKNKWHIAGFSQNCSMQFTYYYVLFTLVVIIKFIARVTFCQHWNDIDAQVRARVHPPTLIQLFAVVNQFYSCENKQHSIVCVAVIANWRQNRKYICWKVWSSLIRFDIMKIK